MLLYFVVGTVVKLPGLVQASGQRRPALAQQLVKGGASYLRNRGVERLKIGRPELVPERRYSLASRSLLVTMTTTGSPEHRSLAVLRDYLLHSRLEVAERTRRIEALALHPSHHVWVLRPTGRIDFIASRM